jgi:hypothetical protein
VSGAQSFERERTSIFETRGYVYLQLHALDEELRIGKLPERVCSARRQRADAQAPLCVRRGPGAVEDCAPSACRMKQR